MDNTKMKFDNTKSTIPCPNCTPQVMLIVRTKRINDSQFLGCPNYPACTHTQAIPESWKMKALGQKGFWE
jgi:ssDNA-binding Zn-finger/Zn-ribbon topoisomerase 1